MKNEDSGEMLELEVFLLGKKILQIIWIHLIMSYDQWEERKMYCCSLFLEEYYLMSN